MIRPSGSGLLDLVTVAVAAPPDRWSGYSFRNPRCARIFVDLFLCRHHYRASRGALAAANAVAIDEAGSVLPPPSTSVGTGGPGHVGAVSQG